MEIATVGGSKSKILINPGQTRELGRANGLNSSDRTISRRHVSFFHPSRGQNQAHRLQFEVIGVNPIYVRRHGEVKVLRRFERGEMESGDLFCVSAKDPVWYTLRNVENGGERVVEDVPRSELAGILESGFELNGVEDLQTGDADFSGVDHVKEFGFVVMGHEFDSYPKKMITDIKNWNWFLEESGEDRDDDENKGKKAKMSGNRKRKKGRAKDDEDYWTGDSEDDKELISKSKMVQKPNYVTRSKDVGKPSKSNSKSKIAGKISAIMDDEDMKEEDEDDETLGGFIVEDDNLEKAEESGDEEEEEEEELEEEYDEDEDEDA